MRKCMIVVAGGSGLRMGAEIPKQFLLLKGRPLLMHTLENLHAMDGDMRLVLVLPDTHIPTWEELWIKHGLNVPHTTVAGGKTRFRSVQNGLAATGDCGLIGVHDGVRPFVSARVVNDCFEAASHSGAAVPVTPIVQSLRKVEGDRSTAVDRSAYRSVQTPQCFSADLLRDAFAKAEHDLFTDDAAVVEAIGHTISLVDGNDENIKVTTPMDLRLAEMMCI